MHSNAVTRLIALVALHLTLANSGFAEYGARQPDDGSYDLLIRNGTIVDGTGRMPFKADILVRGDTIVFVGELGNTAVTARRIINAQEKTVTPGFIDLHSHGDPTEGPLLNFLAQGYTTVTLGQDGQTAGVGENVLTLHEWMSLVEESGSEVNIATLSGHGTLRHEAGVGSVPEPSAEQIERMKELLRRDLAAGAFGMSLGLEYDPGRYSSAEEGMALGEVVGEHGGVVMSHLRTEDAGEIQGAIAELLALNSNVHVSHMKIVSGRNVEESKAVLDQMAGARALGRAVTGDVYPYMASASDFIFLYPNWAKKLEDYTDAVKSRRPELEAHIESRVEERLGPQSILLVKGEYAGMNFSEVATTLGKSYVDVMIDDLGYGGPQQAHFIMSPEVQNEFIRGDYISISTDGSPQLDHPRSAGSTVKVLEEHVGEPPKMSLQRAVHKLSKLPAEILGLENRGVIEEGAKADIVIMTLEDVHNRATWAEPMLPPTGFDLVIVNGIIALESGQAVGGRYGRLLRRAQSASVENAE